ncbi:hypothetical protein B0T26DRAFT_712834 [Lasiosphaeria miniovina]|uniref:Uncharacterized protein n=1 Tax=Lasiosphaeria miniovina TaxID=1954250 RepID=A0AA40AM50_9PEZI|nr:uncharacterized protein B0T26DRAFT_712834 [Lasiosphaeria miniovina]KAK0718320.1 hypothetical protein B0T26DRAFT_712834 [Lasiosphaeria miniovina]
MSAYVDTQNVGKVGSVGVFILSVVFLHAHTNKHINGSINAHTTEPTPIFTAAFAFLILVCHVQLSDCLES